jgi:CPA1 family monovalent cation:H+ antiporter
MIAAAVALHLLAGRMRLPPSAALLIGGGAALVLGLPAIPLDPELILVLFLPPLLFDGASYTAFGRHLPASSRWRSGNIR